MNTSVTFSLAFELLDKENVLSGERNSKPYIRCKHMWCLAWRLCLASCCLTTTLLHLRSVNWWWRYAHAILVYVSPTIQGRSCSV